MVWNHGSLWLSIYWECHHPNCYSLIFFRGVGIPPTRYIYMYNIYIYIYTCHIIRSIKSPSSSWEFLHVLNVLYGFFTRCVQVFRGHTVGSLGIWEKTMKTYKMVISWDFMGFNETYMDLYGIYSWFLIGISWCLTPISLWTTMVSVGDTVYRTS